MKCAFAVLVALVVAVAACDSAGSGDAHSGDPAGELEEAIAATASSSSFRTTSTPVDPETGEGLEDKENGEGYDAGYQDFEAPDRVRDVTRGATAEDDVETLFIGPATYSEAFNKPGFYTEVPNPEGYTLADELLDLLSRLSKAVTAIDVTQDGDIYSFTLPPHTFFDGETRVEATIDAGRLGSLELSGESFGEEATTSIFFSMYDSVSAIHAPPTDRVLPFEGYPIEVPEPDPIAPPCGPDGKPPPGSLVCEVRTPDKP